MSLGTPPDNLPGGGGGGGSGGGGGGSGGGGANNIAMQKCVGSDSTCTCGNHSLNDRMYGDWKSHLTDGQPPLRLPGDWNGRKPKKPDTSEKSDPSS